jgi:hypothetical protein
MNARSYRVDLRITPLDFPPTIGLGGSQLTWASEPHLDGDKLRLNITKQYLLIAGNNPPHRVLAVESIYLIPQSQLKAREDVYEFYKDATLMFNETYRYAESQMPDLPKKQFEIPPIEEYEKEIDRVFSLLNSRN